MKYCLWKKLTTFFFRFLVVDDLWNKLWFVHTVEYYTIIKNVH